MEASMLCTVPNRTSKMLGEPTPSAKDTLYLRWCARCVCVCVRVRGCACVCVRELRVTKDEGAGEGEGVCVCVV